MKNKFKIVDVTKPKDGFTVYLKRFWACIDGDATKAIFYDNNPQCNTNKQIIERFINYDKIKSLGKIDIVYLETAYIP